MSYNKHTWATGNVVGAVDLNRMEQGIEDASSGGAEPLIVNYDHRDTETMIVYYDKSWQEVYDAAKVGSNVVLINEDENIYTLGQALNQFNKLYAIFGSGDNYEVFTADSANEYLHSLPIN